MNEINHAVPPQEGVVKEGTTPRYVAPEILELGKAEDLVLGNAWGAVPEFWPPFVLWC